MKNRWLIATSAVCIHLSIGSVYSWSVFTKPITAQLGWSLRDVQLTFSVAIFFLGLSAALFGHFVEKYGPRRAGTLASLMFGIGIAGSGLAIFMKNIYALYFCYGVLGGIGLGTGYIAPVSTLVKWFPDRRGMATGLAIMGFGFASFIAGPIIQKMVVYLGLANTFYVLGLTYFVIIFTSSQYLAPPPAGWVPEGLKGHNVAVQKAVKADFSQLSANEAVKTRRFYWLWLMLFINITCGIAVISVAAPMAQEWAGMTAGAAAVMVGIMGLFNGAGRIAWASFSDYAGRPNTYTLFFLLQIVMFFLLLKMPGGIVFQILIFLIMTCYGGGFACIPAYIADLFGTKQLGAIHGYILTAWATAGFAGPTFLAWTRQVTGNYAGVLTIFLGLFLIGLIISLIIRLDLKAQAGMKSHEKPEYMAEKIFEVDISGINALIDFVTNWALKVGLSEHKISRLQLAVEEAATNICGHAYLEEIAINRAGFAYHKGATYNARIKDTRDNFTIELTDGGIPFDPLSVAPPDVSAPLEERKADGLGVFLMRKMVDEVLYVRQEGKNILALIMHKRS